MNDLTRQKANAILSMKRSMLYNNIYVDKVYFTCVNNLKNKIDIDLYYMSNEITNMINNDIKISIRKQIEGVVQ